MGLTDSLLVSVSFSTDTDRTVLLVGRKEPNKPIKIVNAFQGDDALKIWRTLTTKK